RDKEFSSKNISKKQLIEDITNTIAVVKATLKNVSDDDLEKDFPLNINNKISSTKFVLLHLLSHLNYHLGQVNYLRRSIQE
ncbi:MAG: DinB family protein, partial [Bacteroidota bacterium]|nr:DinB family protein [Bacteroidota bacterium]